MQYSRIQIEEMKELELQKRVLIPLFIAMGYKDVQHFHGGPMEQGKDVVMWKEEFSQRINTAVVVKAEKISGKATGASSAGEVKFQVDQCFSQPLKVASSFDPITIQRCIVVTSREISKEAVNSLRAVLEENKRDKITTLIDGNKLWELVETYLHKTNKPIERNLERNSRRNFIYTQIAGQGLFDLESHSNPYLSVPEATDFNHIDFFNAVYSFVWLPNAQYLKSPQLQSFTPSAAICTINPSFMVNQFREALDRNLAKKIQEPPRKLLGVEKERFLKSMGKTLYGNFLIGVTFPALMLGVGKSKLELAYHSIIDLFILPILGRHKQIGFKTFHLYLSSVGDMDSYLMKLAKTALKAYFPKKGTYHIELISEGSDWKCIERMACMLSWIVGRFYNSGDSYWVNLLEEELI